MKIDSLTLGSWVSLSSGSEVFKVEAIEKHGVKLSSLSTHEKYVAREDEITPLKISHELLLDLGFIKQSRPATYKENYSEFYVTSWNDEYYVEVSEYMGNWWVITIPCINSRFEVSNVHQLISILNNIK